MMPIRYRRRLLAAALALPPLALHASAAGADRAPPPMDGTAALVNAFEVICTLNALDVDVLSAYAKGVRLTPLGDTAGSTPTGEKVRERRWAGTLTTGPFVLRVEEMRGAKGVVTACAIDGPVTDADAFRAAVMRSQGLATAPAPQQVDGTTTYYWDHVGQGAGGDTSLVVRALVLSGRPAAEVKRVRMVKASP